jgi:hypothetical protein
MIATSAPVPTTISTPMIIVAAFKARMVSPFNYPGLHAPRRPGRDAAMHRR